MAGAKTVSSAANPAVKRLKSLALKKYRDAEGLFIVEGARHVGDALREGWEIDTLAFSPRAADDPVLETCPPRSCLEVTDDILGRVTGRDNAQPVLGAFRQRWHSLDGVRDGLWIGLEGIRDPGNLGTILRSGDAVGVKGVMLIGDTCDPWSPEAVRATMGSFARVGLARASLSEFLVWRREWKGRVVGTHLKTDTDYRTADYRLPLLLVMGGEQSGLSDDLARSCDTLVKIPMKGGAESLNLAVSTGIMLYEISRNSL
jgi:RNA methyltransferase, TrmH family